MSEMKTLATVQTVGKIILKYNPKSEEFKETLSEYRETIDPHGTEKDVIGQTAYSIVNFGPESMVEGVGYLEYNGIKKQPYSGIKMIEHNGEIEVKTERIEFERQTKIIEK